MSAPAAATTLSGDIILACLSCGDPFTPESLAGGVLPILFSCGHTVCMDCANNVALALSGFTGKWACGWCKRGDGGVVNAGVIALLQCATGDADLGPALRSLPPGLEPIAASSAPMDPVALSVEATAAITTALADLERVNTARRSMLAGYESSKTSFIAGIDALLSAIIAHRDRVLGEAKQLFDAREKALGAQVEELSVKVSLLRQAVDVCKLSTPSGSLSTNSVYASARSTIKGFSSAPFGGLAAPPVVSIAFDIEDVWRAMESNVHIKRGVSAADCELSGPGLEGFIPGGTDADSAREQNVLRLVCRDNEHGVVEGVGVRDVALRVLTTGGTVRAGSQTSVSAVRDALGVFRFVYAVDSEATDAVDLEVRVHGEPVDRSPVRVRALSRFGFHGSTVLSSVAPATVDAFVVGMKSWLPEANPPTLLFRMSRDGTATSAFHSRCDGKPSTVVLILSDKGHVFGGYASREWDSDGDFIPCGKSFIFTVSNVHGIPPTRYILNSPNRALMGHADCGPVFGGSAIYVGAADGSLTSPSSAPFNSYYDSTGEGPSTFTGTSDEAFTVAELEVWQVPQ